MEIKHPPENGNCSCKECYKSMSKLDELDKCNGNPNCPRAKIGHLGEICKKVICICNTNARKYYEAGRIEEREAMKKVVEKMKKKHFEFECSECRKSRHYESFCECSDCPGAAKENNYNKALSDLLNELNKN